MKINFSFFRKELPAVVISILAMFFAILSFFGVTYHIFPKDKIPSAILALISVITIAEMLERWDLREYSKQELKTISSTLVEAESELKSISNIAQLIEKIEGENFVSNQGFSGEWFSFYEGYIDPVEPAQGDYTYDWCPEIIKIDQLGRLLYIETKYNKNRENVKALGKVIDQKTLIGHWITSIRFSDKQGEFLLQKKQGDGDVLFGTYNAPHNTWHHPFYKWILIKKRDPKKNKVKSHEKILQQIKVAWTELKPLTLTPDLDLSALTLDSLNNWLSTLESLEKDALLNKTSAD